MPIKLMKFDFFKKSTNIAFLWNNSLNKIIRFRLKLDKQNKTTKSCLLSKEIYACNMYSIKLSFFFFFCPYTF